MATQVYIPPEKPVQIWQGVLLDSPQTLQIPNALLHLEIGPGNGAFVMQQCQNHPDQHFIAVEKKFKRFQIVYRRAEQLKITNLTVICGDARVVLHTLLNGLVFQAIYILFPDPWPKRAHAKHRLIKPYFVEFLKSFLSESGILYFATDEPNYAEESLKYFSQSKEFHMQAFDSLFSTYFEQKWKRMGRNIHYFSFLPKGTVEKPPSTSLDGKFNSVTYS